MHYLRHNKTSILWLILFLSLNASVLAQETAFVQLKGSPEFTLTSGEEKYIPLSFIINEGYHIQANQVKDENLIPSAISFQVSDELILGDPVFPQAVEFRMKGTEEVMDVYSDVLEINVPVRMLNPVEKGVLLVKGKLYYQACDDAKCYYPRDLDFTIKINIE